MTGPPPEYHLDYETFSLIDLTEVGAGRYAADPSTEILMFAISCGDEGPYLWVNPKHDPLGVLTHPRARPMLAKAIKDRAIIWAHNAQFECFISTYRLGLDVGLPVPDINLWRCTAAMARTAGLPSHLEEVAELLGGAKKDPEGKALIKKFSMPQPRTGKRILPEEDFPAFIRFAEYCLQDVRAERDVHRKLKPFELKGAMLESFQFDMLVNHRGLPVNVAALRNAQKILDEVIAKVTLAFEKGTGGLRPTQREATKDLLATLGVEMDNMQEDTVKDTLVSLRGKAAKYANHYAKPLAILELYSVVQYAAAKKVYTMLACVGPHDNMVRGTLMWYGAGTGRWSGRTVQPQNFKKPTLKQMDLAYEMICNGCTADDLNLLWGNALEVIASCIRHFIQDTKGGAMIDADYNAIEARIVVWLAGQDNVVQMYRDGRDLYKYMAGRVYGKAEESIVNPSDERELGKRCILGCGYQMGPPKFRKTCADQYDIHISEELAEQAVEAYRTLCDKVVGLWSLCDKAARAAVAKPGAIFETGANGKLRFQVRKVAGIDFLFMRLPSGREIAYPRPMIEKVRSGGYDREQVTYYGNIKGKIWGRVSMYGGKWVENATQGVAFDIMSIGAVNATKRGHVIWTLIHDQAPSQKGTKSVKDYVAALTDLPSWAAGLPIKAEGREIPYYKK